MMRVIHVYKDYWPVLGGIENHVRLLAEHQARRGHQVTVVVTALTGPTTRSVEGGVTVIRARRLATIASTPLSVHLVHELGRLRGDITHLHFPYPMGELADLLRRPSPRRVVTYHSDIVRQRFLGRLYRPLQERVLDGVDRILPTSEAYVSSSPFLARRRHKCSVVPLGIELDPYLAVDPEMVERVRAEHPAPRILFVGKLRYYKGLGTLIEAMSSVEGTLLVVGSGPMETTWRDQAEASPAAGRIRFLGQLEDRWLPPLLTAADVLVLPSCHRSEAFGLVQVEAMAAGTPVISTELGTGTSFVNADHETGLVVPPSDPRALAEALRTLLADPRRRQEMGAQARRRAQSLFSAERMVDRVLEVYAELTCG